MVFEYTSNTLIILWDQNCKGVKGVKLPETNGSPLKIGLPNTTFTIRYMLGGITPMYWFIMAPYKSPPFGSGVAPSTFTMVYMLVTTWK